MADSRWSSRRSASREALSGPWQEKQVLDQDRTDVAIELQGAPRRGILSGEHWRDC